METGSSLRIKRLEHGTDHPPSFSDKVKKRVKLHLYSISRLS
jgi:hypothetical protein